MIAGLAGFEKRDQPFSRAQGIQVGFLGHLSQALSAHCQKTGAIRNQRDGRKSLAERIECLDIDALLITLQNMALRSLSLIRWHDGDRNIPPKVVSEGRLNW